MRWLPWLLATAAVLVSGCATVAPETQSDIDFVKVARVETAARDVGSRVYWMVLPTKSATAVN